MPTAEICTLPPSLDSPDGFPDRRNRAHEPHDYRYGEHPADQYEEELKWSEIEWHGPDTVGVASSALCRESFELLPQVSVTPLQ